ncbi:YigZ family protein [Lutimaribacter saemankumensis]|uniref:Uncharacterized protein family UPF0029 n=1 Tax=Lutimaribacter saemankumensis TaxID=490829 RepID=A0A1G8KTQ5_9RHOB|nr:YigZ family protein [Lutimaribacter saemankumensis]SDI46749.1 Uncharacterized protein family UPF0029 [Lutimaribacter saemankumensis]
MLVLPNVLSDRGSRYAVSGGAARDADDAAAFIKELKRKKKFAKATHNSWGLILADGTQLKGDDGEAGAGMVILRMLEREGLHDVIVVVTRWYGGKHLGGDRFRHVQSCVEAFLAQWRAGD